MNVLITSVSRKVSLIQAFRSALEAEGGGLVIGTDINPLKPGLYFTDEYHMVPRGDDPGFIDQLVDICCKRQIKVLIPTRDQEVANFARHRKRFEAMGTTIMAASCETVETCQDKGLFIEFCKRNGFPLPRDLDPNNVQPGDFPIFIKPRRGVGSKGAQRVETIEELKKARDGNHEFIVQEVVNAPEFTIDLFSDFNSRVLSVVPRERVFVLGGESYVTRTLNDPVLIKESIRLAEALTLVGHNTIQCFFDGSAIKFIEVNPRYGGASNLGFAAGHPTPLYLIRLLKGMDVPSMIGEFKDGLCMLRYTQDFFIHSSDFPSARFE